MPGHVLYMAPPGGGYARAAERYAKAYGLDVVVQEFAPRKGQQQHDEKGWEKIVRLERGASFILIWNGRQHRTPLIEEFAKRNGIPHAFIEWGMMPQKETLFVDPAGFNGKSVLNGPLSWVTSKDMERLEFVREQEQKKHPISDEGFVLVPMQIQKDTQILYNSPYRSMSEFVEYVHRFFPGTRIVVRQHPSSGGINLPDGVEAPSKQEAGDFLDHAARASAVVGITSTCLFEAAILGKPVLALGDHPLRFHGPHDHDRVCAGALALRTRRDAPDLPSILERFGVRPLGCDPIGGA